MNLIELKTYHTCKGYLISCKVELVEKQDSLIQLVANKSNIEDFFNDLLDEIKGFKY